MITEPFAGHHQGLPDGWTIYAWYEVGPEQFLIAHHPDHPHLVNEPWAMWVSFTTDSPFQLWHCETHRKAIFDYTLQALKVSERRTGEKIKVSASSTREPPRKPTAAELRHPNFSLFA